MKIECILRRPGGTRVPMGDAEYHFAPDSEGRHVSDVANESHAMRLLSITEAYRALGPAAVAPPPASDEVQSPATSTIMPQLERDDADGDAPPQDGQTDAERAALVEQYVAAFSRKPHHKWSNDKIREMIASATAGSE